MHSRLIPIVSALLLIPFTTWAGEEEPPPGVTEALPNETFEEALPREATETLETLFGIQDPAQGLAPAEAVPLAKPSAPQVDPSFGRESQVEAAAQEYRRSGEAEAIRRHDAVIFPFGESQPEVRCSPLRACDIELQPGEAITAVALGDSERWITSPLESGDPASPTPHVIVKPREYDLATNLVIGTTRRTYHLGLISVSEQKADRGEVAYHRHVSFYYPQELVQIWNVREALEERIQARQEEATIMGLGALSVANLEFGYTVRKGRRLPWAPESVFDDGERVYLRLPATARKGDLPALLVESAGTGLAVANVRVQGGWMIVDGLFDRAELVLGVGRKKKAVRIMRLGGGKHG